MSIPDLKSPASQAESSQDQPHKNTILLWIMAGTIICLILIIIILLIRPQTNQAGIMPVAKVNISQKQSQNNNIQNESEKRDNSTNVITNITKEKNEYNEQIEIEWLLKKSKAEAQQADKWADKEYDRTLKLAIEAEQDKKNNNYKSSEDKYKQASQILEHILNNKEYTKTELYSQAVKLLNNNQTEQARQTAEKVQIIDPENRSVNKLLNRIKVRPEILRLQDQAKEAEKQKNIKSAIEKYKNILILDNDYSNAKKALGKLNKNLKNKEFKKNIAQLIVALDTSDLKQAQTSWHRAQKLYPDDSVIKELKQRLDTLQKTQIIQANIAGAQKNQKKEQWYAALKAYKNILKLDPNSNIAVLNIERVKQYITINQSLDAIINSPQRLQNDLVYENSKAIVSSIKAQLNRRNSILYPLKKTPLLNKKIQSAEKIVKDASKIITVQLTSDNKTDVVIYKVGKFGKFINKTLTLRPGIYTIVGSRDGYKDFRKDQKITAEKNNISIKVVCKETI